MSDLDGVRSLYLGWFGDRYDLGALDVVLCAARSEALDGDPPWVMLVGGSGASKTETVTPLRELHGARLVSMLTGEAALLSATPKANKAQEATGGLLASLPYEMEDDRRFHHGLLVIKDFTSVLSMHRDSRAKVISALREVHDGYWVRDVGTDGGMRIPWQGRVVIVACCTSAWDSHREVVAQMGDRFVVVRNRIDRDQAGQQAVGNVGSEGEMRYQLREAVGGLLASPVRDIPAVADTSALLDIADLVTRCRTPVERDYQGNPIWAHALEAPTRFAKQLVGLARGGLSLGMSQEQAMAVAVRASADSMPPNYLAVLAQLAERGEGKPSQLAGWLAWPYQAARRACEELQLLGCVNLTFHDPDTPDRHKSYEVTAAGRAELVKVLAEYERPQ